MGFIRGTALALVDFLGVLIPGILIALSILAFPPIGDELAVAIENGRHDPAQPSFLTILVTSDLASNIYIMSFVFVVLSYLLGMLMWILNSSAILIISARKFLRRWSDEMKNRAQALEAGIRLLVSEPDLLSHFDKEARFSGSWAINAIAPYIEFAKQLIMQSDDQAGRRLQKLEASMNFASGLHASLLFFAIDGVWMATKCDHIWGGSTLALLSSAGFILNFVTYSRRRTSYISEIYTVAITILYMNRTSPNSPK